MLAELICDIHNSIADADSEDMPYHVKTSIHKIETLFQEMKEDFWESLYPSKNTALRARNDAKFFRLIQKRINGARRNILALCDEQAPNRINHA